jgi:hypothetical protein
MGFCLELMAALAWLCDRLLVVFRSLMEIAILLLGYCVFPYFLLVLLVGWYYGKTDF